LSLFLDKKTYRAMKRERSHCG